MTEPTPLPDLAVSLHAFACHAAERAAEILAGGQPRAGSHAASWMRATREALEASRIADAPIADGERAVIAAQTAALRRQVCAVEQSRAELERQRDELVELVTALANTLEIGADATGATHAARARRDLAAIFPDALDRQEADEARGELSEAIDRGAGHHDNEAHDTRRHPGRARAIGRDR